MNTPDDRRLNKRLPRAALGQSMEETMGAGRRSAFRLLTFVLLICAVWDRILRAGGWQIVGGCAVTLLLVGIVAFYASRNRKTTLGPLPIHR